MENPRSGKNSGSKNSGSKEKQKEKKEPLYDDRSDKEAEREARLTSGGRGPTEGDPAAGFNHLVEDQAPSERAAVRRLRK